MKKSCVVIGNANHIKIADAKVWQDFIHALNNPSKETVDNRKRFFEECDKLVITREDDFIRVESESLDTEEILKALRGVI